MKCLLKYNFFHFIAAAALASSYLSSLHVSLYIHSLCLVYIFFSSLFRPPTKIIIVIKQSFTHNLSMLNVVGLFFSFWCKLYLFHFHLPPPSYLLVLIIHIFIFLCNLQKQQQWKIIKICGYFTGIKNISNLRLAFFFFISSLIVTRLAPSVHSTN